MHLRAFLLGATLIASGPASAQLDTTLVRAPMGVVDFQNIPDVAAASAHWIRIPAEWRFIEPADDAFQWNSGITTWIDQAASEGINVSPIIAIGKLWANGFEGQEATWPSYPPSDIQDTFDPVYGYSESYYNFVSSFLGEYKDRIDRVTIENEANTQEFWRGTVDDYRKILATAYKARNDSAPDVLIFDSGLGSGSWGVALAQHLIETGSRAPSDILQIANDWYADDFYAPFHWNDYQSLVYWIYQPFVQDNIKRVDFMLATVPQYADGLNFKFTGRSWLLPELVSYMDERMAEFGQALPLKINNEASNWELQSPADEGQNLFKMVIVQLSLNVDQTLWFPWSNEITSTPRRGLLDDLGNPTPQYGAFQNISDRMGTEASYVSMDTIGTNLHRYRFQYDADAEPRLDAIWWDNGGHGAGSEVIDLVLPAGTELVTRFLYDGTMQGFPVTTDTLNIEITHEGAFFVYSDQPVDVDPVPPVVNHEFLRNAPNPFHSSATIHFRIPGDLGSPVSYSLKIYDIAGRVVRTLTEGTESAGWHETTWDGRDDAGREVAAGSYWYRLTTPSFTSAKRMLRVR